MPSITVNLTDAQKDFLKLFAKNHHPGADDNLGTDIPIHVVQTKEVDYFPTNEENASETLDTVVFSALDLTGDTKFKTPNEMVRAYFDIMPPEPAKVFDYSEAKGKKIDGIDGKEHSIYSLHSYFEAYGITDYQIYFVHESWRTVAFFFILSEARRYLEYQSHNLREPRIFSYSPGYSNDGDYRHFYELLRHMGETLIELDSLDF